AAISQWVDDGAEEGDASDQGEAVVENRAKLSRVDMTLTMPVSYTPKLSPDEYRCFVIDWPNQATTYVTGLGVTPGTPAIVHHVIAFLAPPDQVADYQALDAADPEP